MDPDSPESSGADSLRGPDGNAGRFRDSELRTFLRFARERGEKRVWKHAGFARTALHFFFFFFFTSFQSALMPGPCVLTQRI